MSSEANTPLVTIHAITSDDQRELRSLAFAESVRLHDAFLPLVDAFQARDLGTSFVGDLATKTADQADNTEVFVIQDQTASQILGMAALVLVDSRRDLWALGLSQPTDFISGWSRRMAGHANTAAIATELAEESKARLTQRGISPDRRAAVIHVDNRGAQRLVTKLGMRNAGPVSRLQLRNDALKVGGHSTKRPARLWIAASER